MQPQPEKKSFRVYASFLLHTRLSEANLKLTTIILIATTHTKYTIRQYSPNRLGSSSFSWEHFLNHFHRQLRPTATPFKEISLFSDIVL